MMAISLFLAALAAQSGALSAAPAFAPGLAAIDYARGGGIRDWYAEDDRGIFLRDRANRWYYAAFDHRCPGVLYDYRLTFDTDGFTRFDRTSRIQTQTMTCGIAALDASDAPADKGGKTASR